MDVLPDADGMLRRVPLLARWNDRVVVHLSLAALASHRGVSTNQLSLRDRELEISADESVLVDVRGRLVVNWPFNRQQTWDKVVPQLSVADLLQLARYDADIEATKNNLRLHVTLLDKYQSLQFGCEQLLLEIWAKSTEGPVDAARPLSMRFDEKMVPNVLAHPSVRGLYRQLDEGVRTDVADEANQALISAKVIREIQRELPHLEDERRSAIERLQRLVQGKLCLVGDTTTGSSDLKLTPVGQHVPGVSVIAASLNTMLTGRYLRTCAGWTAMVVTAVVAIAMSVVFFRAHALMSLVSAASSMALLFFGHLILLERADVLLSPVLAMTCTASCYVTVTTLRWWRDYREKREIRQAFQHYLHPTVVDRICRDPQQLKLGGEELCLSILFSDIRGFSSMSEELSPIELVRLLNEYLTAMTDTVFAYGGTVDKYIGDALMAFYGAPVPFDDHEYRACCTALDMLERLNELRNDWQARGLPAIYIGLGINTDEVVVGNMGSQMRFDYTVMGDGVNLASRLEGVTKYYAVSILVSERTHKAVQDRIATREIDCIRVKGKDEVIRVFEVVGRRPLLDEKIRSLATFDRGLNMYRQQRWQAATDLFRQVLATSPDDGPSRVLLERCESFQGSPPPANWDGVFVMTEK